jgi:hypothetical protein
MYKVEDFRATTAASMMPVLASLFPTLTAEELAEDSVAYADALIAELAKETTK